MSEAGQSQKAVTVRDTLVAALREAKLPLRTRVAARLILAVPSKRAQLEAQVLSNAIAEGVLPVGSTMGSEQFTFADLLKLLMQILPIIIPLIVDMPSTDEDDLSGV